MKPTRFGRNDSIVARFAMTFFVTFFLASQSLGMQEFNKEVSRSESRRYLYSQSSAMAVFADYTNNALRITSAKDEYDVKGCRDLFHANAPFQLAVAGGDVDVRQICKRINGVCSNMSETTLAYLKRYHILAPTLQWLVRKSFAAQDKPSSYLRGVCHPAAFDPARLDFNVISNASASLKPEQVPPVAFVRQIYWEYKADPTLPALPLVDYPDTHLEVTFSTPCAINIVLRAPDRFRKFRFFAFSFPGERPNTKYKWSVVNGPFSGVECRSFTGRHAYGVKGYEMVPSKGYCEIIVDREKVGPRLDVAVFAQADEGDYGPPAIISFHALPSEIRGYDPHGIVNYIQYIKSDKADPLLYDFKDWTDYFDVTEKGVILEIDRRRNNFSIGKFSREGDKILSSYQNGMPKECLRIRYAARQMPSGGTELVYEETDGEVITLSGDLKPSRRNDYLIK